MGSTTQQGTAEVIVAKLGGPGNIVSLTHCATRLRFVLNDSSQVDQKAVEAIPGVMGAVPQSGDRFQVVIGGAVQSMFNQIMNLPEMAGLGKNQTSDADVKAAARAKGRGKAAWVDSFFEYLSDSFRPLLGVLLGASLIIAFASVLDAFNVIDFRAADKSASWIFVDAMWRSVFYFLPIMVAYNAAKKLNIDPWVGAAVMGALMTPEFSSLSDVSKFTDTVCTTSSSLGTESCVAQVFGLPMQLNGYGGQVFVPLIMVAVLALVYKGLQRIFPANIQMVFVPFFSMIIMIPVTAFLIGPTGIWLGNGVGNGLSWMNGHAPILFAIIIPLVYPFLVPLGLHWPLNALMLVNIQTLGYDFIQGPMGAWNFACFGATAGVLFIAIRDKESEMRETATGALAAGLLGGISEPSLYGIHLRFKRIYPRMLVGCLVGGLITGLSGGVTTGAFAFTSLLTIPVFSPMPLYAISIAAAFVTAMVLVIISDYRTPEQKAESLANRLQAESDLALEAASVAAPSAAAPSVASTTVSAPTTAVVAPIAGHVVPLSEVEDKVFASGTLGEGVGIRPTDGRVTSPVAGLLVTVPTSGHAYGIKTDDGVEVLVHIGIDTVRLEGRCFEVAVKKGRRVAVGDLLVDVDLDGIREAGYDSTTVVVVTNSKTLSSVVPTTGVDVVPGDTIMDVAL
ncbi:glucose PTS transporter subunit IIA [Sanguibacter antarcticus]|uniref:PTS system IIA component (Glc family) /PTS system IIB component (Glc family) /PTS system IIC component (Glc family) n=1 Tax=Sanguibacter antarcticus TaxID=372484 RepID=A0A2A9E3B6_9MICO|nr:glucose PTS transporter subunit IIA [Sanguibacter antarcticus]PFG32855.1 PTS system IIA component (Glc family) /PTS system IIB component (Glc family) /PTS system IIC component (Glc family) [Sanguibacter antarcticus]